MSAKNLLFAASVPDTMPAPGMTRAAATSCLPVSLHEH
jgi:hypothetical protein